MSVFPVRDNSVPVRDNSVPVRDNGHTGQTVARKVICRYRRRNGDMCTGEVLDPDGDILLCARHLAAAASEFRRITERAQR